MHRRHSLRPKRDYQEVHTLPTEMKHSLFDCPQDGGGHTSQVRVFDAEGNLTTKQIGIKSFRFHRLTLFYSLRSQPWSYLISLSVLLYLSLLLLLSLSYFMWSMACGAGSHTSWISSLYFTIVSLAANGGYMGEDDTVMTNPRSVCYRGRTVIVMVCSYVNIIFVGIVTALVVGKAEFTGKLGHRIVFSNLCTLNCVPGRIDMWRLCFRIAKVQNFNALASGRLRLFCVTAEPLKAYRRHIRERKARRYRRRVLEQRGGAELAARTHIVSVPLTRDALTARRAGASGSTCPMDTSAHNRLTVKRPKARHRRRTTSREGRPRSPRDTARSQAVEHEDRPLPGSPEAHSFARRTEDLLAARNLSHARLPASSSNSTNESLDIEILSAKTNTSISDSEGTPLQSPLSPTATALFRSASNLYGSTDVRKDSYIGRGQSCRSSFFAKGDHREGDVAMERVRVKVSELQWTCSEEEYLSRGSGQLLLWYPVHITHVVDERSPLFRFLESSRNGTHLSGSVTQAPAHFSPGGDAPSAAGTFQIVAVVEATEMESGAAIMAKHTYTTTDIVEHYKFSNKLVHMQPHSKEVLLDYHYFNEVLPSMAVESSTTDSEAADISKT